MKTHIKPYLLFFLLFSITQCTKENCAMPNDCKLEPETGNCYALIKRYYYDQEEDKCKSFNWGGCDGVVPFETLEACKICECNN